MSTTLPRSQAHATDQSRGRKNSLPKIKAPFRLTTMNQRGQSSLIWVWSRRGSQWTVDQELRFDCDSKCDKSGS
jgi:hypothetical protein